MSEQLIAAVIGATATLIAALIGLIGIRLATNRPARVGASTKLDGLQSAVALIERLKSQTEDMAEELAELQHRCSQMKGDVVAAVHALERAVSAHTAFVDRPLRNNLRRVAREIRRRADRGDFRGAHIYALEVRKVFTNALMQAEMSLKEPIR